MALPNLLHALAAIGISKLNTMQEDCLQELPRMPKAIVHAPTGSGKTLSYLLPLWSLLKPESSGIQALVLVPTRELALQIGSVWKSLKTGHKVALCYGGHPISVEEDQLRELPALLVATPGRLKDHLGRGGLHLKTNTILVLDEYDKSLEMGFEEDLEFIYRNFHSLRFEWLVSATATKWFPSFLRKDAFPIKDFTASHENTAQYLRFLVRERLEDALYSLFLQIGREAAIVFCNKREEAEHLFQFLNEHGFSLALYHGGLDQRRRESMLTRFRNGSCLILVTTDLAARGLDIPIVRHVIHAHLPMKFEEFTHRNGRTARMGAGGCIYLPDNGMQALPSYVPSNLPHVTYEHKGQPALAEWETLYISLGKKDKVNKVDIVGFLSKKGNLAKEELGLIEVKEDFSYAAVKADKVRGVLKAIKAEKLKGQGVKIELARD
jgi:superfamily II DNA/RNA helicase